MNLDRKAASAQTRCVWADTLRQHHSDGLGARRSVAQTKELIGSNGREPADGKQSDRRLLKITGRKKIAGVLCKG
jgi:hypothetical protein